MSKEINNYFYFCLVSVFLFTSDALGQETKIETLNVVKNDCLGLNYYGWISSRQEIGMKFIANIFILSSFCIYCKPLKSTILRYHCQELIG